MTDAVVAKLEEKATAPRRGRPPTYTTKEVRAAAFRERQDQAGLVLAWMPKALVAAYRAGRDGAAK